MLRFILISLIIPVLTSIGFADAVSIQGRVVECSPDSRIYRVALTESADDSLKVGETLEFKVGLGDAEINYTGRTIRADAAFYNKLWHLERVFPVDGAGAKAMEDVNSRLHKATGTMSRRKYVKQGEYIPNFAMIDQNGNFLQIRELQGKAFVLNFIFTRCTVPTMCPASTTRMSQIQDSAREAGLDDLHFVTITFDPEFDSPGILRQYAAGYEIDMENFHMLTGTRELVEDLLRQFGILTMEEDGTINHTMATLLVDATGRVAYRKEGATWTAKEFLEAAKKL